MRFVLVRVLYSAPVFVLPTKFVCFSKSPPLCAFQTIQCRSRPIYCCYQTGNGFLRKCLGFALTGGGSCPANTQPPLTCKENCGCRGLAETSLYSS